MCVPYIATRLEQQAYINLCESHGAMTYRFSSWRCFEGAKTLGRNDTQLNNTKHNDTQYNDTQYNDTLHNDTQYNDTQFNDTQ